MSFKYKEQFMVVEYKTRLIIERCSSYQDAVEFITYIYTGDFDLQIEKVWIREWER